MRNGREALTKPINGRAHRSVNTLLLDIFGRTWPEDEWFEVDRAAVVRYKMKVEANMAALRQQIVDLLR